MKGDDSGYRVVQEWTKETEFDFSVSGNKTVSVRVSARNSESFEKIAYQVYEIRA